MAGRLHQRVEADEMECAEMRQNAPCGVDACPPSCRQTADKTADSQMARPAAATLRAARPGALLQSRPATETGKPASCQCMSTPRRGP